MIRILLLISIISLSCGQHKLSFDEMQRQKQLRIQKLWHQHGQNSKVVYSHTSNMLINAEMMIKLAGMFASEGDTVKAEDCLNIANKISAEVDSIMKAQAMDDSIYFKQLTSQQ